MAVVKIANEHLSVEVSSMGAENRTYPHHGSRGPERMAMTCPAWSPFSASVTPKLRISRRGPEEAHGFADPAVRTEVSTG